jgi:hypothetical protein
MNAAHQNERAVGTPFAGWSKAKRALDNAIIEARTKAAAQAGTNPLPLVPRSVHDLRRIIATGLQLASWPTVRPAGGARRTINALWGASRIHGELLKLGYEVAQSTVSKYMARGGKPPSQSWKTFLRNHAEAIAAIDMCMVPTLSFERLFAFLVLGHGRRQLLWFEVTRHPTAAWLARQITKAFPWASAPAYLVRDNDRAYGHVFITRVC